MRLVVFVDGVDVRVLRLLRRFPTGGVCPSISFEVILSFMATVTMGATAAKRLQEACWAADAAREGVWLPPSGYWWTLGPVKDVSGPLSPLWLTDCFDMGSLSLMFKPLA